MPGVREYTEEDLPSMIEIRNGVVEEGIAFPQEECLTMDTGREFFSSQTYTAVAVCDAEIKGLCICGHICNASCAVKKTAEDSISENSL